MKRLADGDPGIHYLVFVAAGFARIHKNNQRLHITLIFVSVSYQLRVWLDVIMKNSHKCLPVSPQVLISLMLLLAGALAVGCIGHAADLIVGPDMPLEKPSDAAKVARDGDTVNIERGVYAGDVAVWRQNNLTLRGIGGRAHLKAEGEAAQGKAIWVIKGDNTVVENVEFSGATVPDENGAGIRQEGRNLIVRNSFFHDNENGILAGANDSSEILIENSEFAYNGYGDGYTHNIYIGRIRKLTVRHSYFHHADTGHQIKSRAAENIIASNRLMDEDDGNSSYIIDISNGGFAVVTGNLIQQGERSENWAILSYAAEGGEYDRQELFVVNNTFVNDRGSGIFVVVGESADNVLLVNNIFVGAGEILQGSGELVSNLASPQAPGFVDRNDHDYRLTMDSDAIDAGTQPGVADGVDLLPVTQYVHPADSESRVLINEPDVGAYEYTP